MFIKLFDFIFYLFYLFCLLNSPSGLYANFIQHVKYLLLVQWRFEPWKIPSAVMNQLWSLAISLGGNIEAKTPTSHTTAHPIFHHPPLLHLIRNWLFRYLYFVTYNSHYMTNPLHKRKSKPLAFHNVTHCKWKLIKLPFTTCNIFKHFILY